MKEKIHKRIRQVTKKVVEHTWVVRAVRFGYVVRGMVYVLTGVFGMQLALGLRVRGANLTEIIIAIASQGLGKVFLVLIISGLTAYSMWGFLRGVVNVLHKKNNLIGWLTRFGFLVSAVSYGSLAWAGGSLFQGISVAGKSNDPSQFSAKVLTIPFGQEILMVIGLCFLLGAISQTVIALNSGFKNDLRASEWRKKREKWTVFFAKSGIISRSIVLGMVGIFIIRAGFLLNSATAMGTGEVMDYLLHVLFGQFIVGGLSVGLAMFGTFSIISSRYLKFPEE